MAGRMKVTFEVADVDAEERLIREYIAPAFERLCEREDVRWPSFNRYGHDPSIEAGRVVLLAFGDVEAVVDDERARWTRLVEDGLVVEWRIGEDGPGPEALDDQERLRFRMRSVASRMSLEFFDTFEEFPDGVGGIEDGEVSFGWDFCLHHLNNQLGYQADEGEEEIDLLFQSLTGRLRALGVAHGVEAADEKIEGLTGELGTLSAELYRQRGDHGR